MPVRIPDPWRIPDNKCCSKPLHLEVICYMASLPQQAQANRCTVFLSQRLVTMSQPRGSRRAPHVFWSLPLSASCFELWAARMLSEPLEVKGSPKVCGFLLRISSLLPSPVLITTIPSASRPSNLSLWPMLTVVKRRAPGHVTSYMLTPSQLCPR